MTLNELKIRCLKKIKANDDDRLVADSLEELAKERDYSKYINNLNGSINDAIKRLVISEKIPFKSFEIEIKSSVSSINPQITDLFKIQAILHEDSDGIVQIVEYTELPNKILLGEKFNNGKLMIIYSPKISEITDSTEGTTDLETLGLNELACGFIIYFVKCELYEALEPQLAIQWRSYAESYLSAMTQEVRVPKQRKVKEVIKLGRY